MDRSASVRRLDAGLLIAFLVIAVCSTCSTDTEKPAGALDASFTFSPASPVTGETVRFTDRSSGAPSAWRWSFDDGTTGTAQNPSHAFQVAGIYTVTLTISKGSLTDSVSQTVGVGQSTSILPPDRSIDWSKAGVWHNDGDITRPMEGTKGIPDFPVGLTVDIANPAHPYYCDPTGTTDCRINLQAAINACPLGSAVSLPAGTYALSPGLAMRTSVVLRGAGPGSTRLRMLGTGSVRSILFHGAGGASESIIMDPGQGPDSGNISGPVQSGCDKGSSTVVLSQA
ncbi:MAG: hypothetical protein H6P98_2680, partial [Candidatus Aminicenantes bacterium]|nr:hypothetical protein [Candidatus Aminicenantes bacterium]